MGVRPRRLGAEGQDPIFLESTAQGSMRDDQCMDPSSWSDQTHPEDAA
jgi:hypothetical protein